MRQSNSLSYSIFPLLFLFVLTCNLTAQTPSNAFVFGDALPDAPELAPRGEYRIGVRTLDLVHKSQIDILNSKEGESVLYDRPLKVEIWYPAEIPNGQEALVVYEEVLGMSSNPERPLIPFTFAGRALRDAAPKSAEVAYPLVIVSHGYVGSRYLMTYLTENLASKGYVVVAIDHTESTFKDAGPFPSTLLNRAKDIRFVLNEVADLNTKSEFFLQGLVDVDKTGIVGYSMGGYGVLNVGGAGYSDFAVQFFSGMTKGNKALTDLAANNENYASSVDPRIKAIVAFAPWGMERGVWDAEGLKGLKIPTFFVAGSQDDISGYEKGIKAIYEGAIHADRFLLTYANARHNVAPNPPPAASLQAGLHFDEYYRYAEPAWDEERINNINQHFVSAFLGIHLQGKDYQQYLDLPERPDLGKWVGFKPRSAVGLELLHGKPADSDK